MAVRTLVAQYRSARPASSDEAVRARTYLCTECDYSCGRARSNALGVHVRGGQPTAGLERVATGHERPIAWAWYVENQGYSGA